MKLRLALIVAATVLATACGADAQSGRNERKSDEIVNFRDTDAEMNAAMAEARRTLPTFWKLLASDPVVAETGKIKVGFDTSGGLEHIWVREVRYEKGVVRGLLDNRPVYLEASKGDPVTIDPAKISDWSYIRNDRMYGSFTTRVMLPSLDPEQREGLRQFLSDKPLEDGRR